MAAALVCGSNEKWLSPISVWETLMLADHGRLVLEPDPVAWVRRELDRVPLRQAPVSHEVAIESHVVGLRHRDPADRFLAATARVYELTLVTADRRLLRSTRVETLDNR